VSRSRSIHADTDGDEHTADGHRDRGTEHADAHQCAGDRHAHRHAGVGERRRLPNPNDGRLLLAAVAAARDPVPSAAAKERG
jgi:hypothetical protein